MPPPGKIAKEAAEIERAIIALRNAAKKLSPEKFARIDFELTNAAQQAKMAAAAEAANKLDDGHFLLEGAYDAQANAHDIYNEPAVPAQIERRKVTVKGMPPLSPPRKTGVPMPKILPPGAAPMTPEEIEDQAERIKKVTAEISEMQTAIAAKLREQMTDEERELVEQASALTKGATEQLGAGQVGLAERIVREAAGRFAKALGLPTQAELTAELLMPQEERIALLAAVRDARAHYRAELRAGRKEEALRWKRLETEYMKIIAETYPLARLERWLAEYRILHPRMRYVALTGEKLVGFLRSW